MTVLPTPPETPPTMTTKTFPNKGVEVTSPMVATPPQKVQEVPPRWMKPFEVDWMLRAICEVHSGNATHAALCIWMHKD